MNGYVGGDGIGPEFWLNLQKLYELRIPSWARAGKASLWKTC
jgi:plasmid maintenance system antidote protein VapI